MRLDEQDVRKMVRLVGDVAPLPGDHMEKKRFLMKGLCDLVKADAWFWALSCQRHPDKPQVYVSILNGGLSEDSFVKLLKAIEHPEMIGVAGKFFEEIKEKGTHLTRERGQITDLTKFKGTNAHQAWKEADIGPTMMSLRPLDEQSSSLIALYRRYNREEFNAREVRIAHILLTEVSWLHEQGWPENRGSDVPALSRRQRLALNLLAMGHTRKQISDEMQISMNTTHGYVKEVYRHLRVSSQLELMNRFFKGDRGDL